jgi:hypothetical protein
VSLSDDLEHLATSIRQLQARWDMYFSGVERRPPNEVHARVEKLIREYDRSVIRNNADRFRLQGLVSRFNTLNELWQKRLRAREEGRAFGFHGRRAEAAEAAAPPPPEPSGRSRPGGPGEFRVGDAERDDAAVRALYDRFVEERQRVGEGAAPAYENFRQLIGKQTARILGDKGARAVDFRLDTKDGKVALKAKVVK